MNADDVGYNFLKKKGRVKPSQFYSYSSTAAADAICEKN